MYYFLKYLFFFVVYIFYRRIHVENEDRVPADGPVILASNHPNTMMDPLLVALYSGRNPHFLAKSTLFKTWIQRWFLNSAHVLPVYRKQDAQSEMGRNEEIFERCYQSLEAGQALVIMPEGMSQMDGTLHEIKTGTARIGLGAELRNAFELGVHIIPAGINYDEPTKFFADVHCRFGRPIDLRDFKDIYAKDEYEAVYQVTNQIRDALEKLTTTVESTDTAEVLQNLRVIYKMELAVDLGLSEEIGSNDFAVTRGMADAINWYHKHYPEAFQKLDTQMSSYLAKIEGLELRDDLLSTAHGQRTFAMRVLGLLGAILGFPVYLWGLLNNYLPFKTPAMLIKWMKPNVEYLSSIKMVSGFFAAALFYTLQGYIIWSLTQSGLWTSLYLVSLLPTGRFALYYHDTMQRYRQHLRILSLFLRRKTLMYEIIQERVALIQAIDAAKETYLSREEGSDPEIQEDPRA